ncbi:MAG: DUF998 domain-containing protein [Promethearchaeota archaeon]|jgi:hypothetical protein
MNHQKSYLSKFQDFISGGVYGILSVIVGIAGDIIAYLLYPEYNFMKRAVSSLCKGPGGIFFQIGTILSGFFAIFFLLYILQTFEMTIFSEKLKRITQFIVLVSCFSFIILGFFCGSDPVIALIHGTAAVVSWLSGISYITLITVLMLRDPKYSKNLAIFGLIVALSLSSMVFMFILYYVFGLHEIIIILPMWEWFNTFTLSVWYFSVSLYLIFKKI